MPDISKIELEELRAKAEKYDRVRASASKAGKASMAKLTPEERSAKARKALEARKKKLGY